MHDCYKLTALAKALKQTKGYFVVPVEGEELVVMRKEEFDNLKEDKKEVQLELEEVESEDSLIDSNQEKIDLVNKELAMQHADYEDDNTEMDSDEAEQLQVGPRKKVRFEPLRGDLSPELQE